MVLFLVGLVSMILLRTLRKDYARYHKDDDLDDMVSRGVLKLIQDDRRSFRSVTWVTNTGGNKFMAMCFALLLIRFSSPR